ncbi:MAG: hypothetical protein K8U57_29985 [Planctomycetes bacterium]|nr:hypothetical protein [Planctomycetota bacterium]
MQVLTSATGIVEELKFAPDGRALAAVVQQSPFLWDIPATAAPKALADYDKRGAKYLTFSRDSSTVSWIANRRLFEFERDTGCEREVQLLEDSREKLSAITLTGPDSRLVVRTGEVYQQFRYRCFISDGADGWEEKWFVGPNTNLYGGAIAGTETDRFFAWERSVSEEGPFEDQTGLHRLVMRSARTGQILESVPLKMLDPSGLVARRDGSEVVAFHNSFLHVWRPREVPRKVKSGTRSTLRAIAYHPSGNYLFVTSNDKSVCVLDTTSWAVVEQYTWNIGRLTSVAISPEGTLAAAGGEKGQVVLWDVDL